jgi:hypothetical protein
VPEPPVTLDELRVHVRLAESVVTVRATVPVNPFTGAMIITELPGAPAFVVTLVGFAVIMKSG